LGLCTAEIECEKAKQKIKIIRKKVVILPKNKVLVQKDFTNKLILGDNLAVLQAE